MNLKKLFTLLVLFSIILIVIPQTFAADVTNDCNSNITESNLIQVSQDNVLADEDYWYLSQPDDDSASVNYDGGNKNMRFTAEIDPYYSTPGEGRYFGGINLYVYVNGDENKRVNLNNYNGASKDITFDLSIIKSQLVDGKNEVTVHPDETTMNGWWCTKYNFVPADVYYYSSEYDYTVSTQPTRLDYTLGNNTLVTVTSDINSNYADALKDLPMYIWINEQTKVKLNDTMANSESFTFDFKNITSLLSEGEYNISFHPDVDSLKSINPNIRYLFNSLNLNVANPIYDYYISWPDPSDIEEYVGDTDEYITISTEYYEGLDDIMGWFTMCVYINSLDLTHWDFIRGVLANETSFVFNLKDISTELDDGDNTLWFAPQINQFFNIFEGNNYTFIPLNVHVRDTPSIVGYNSTPTPSQVDYALGSSKIITVNASYPYDVDLSDSAMFVYINGEEMDNRVAIEGVDSGDRTFTFDLKDISDKLVDGVNNLTFHPNIGFLEHYIYDKLVFNPLKVTVSIINTTLTVNSTLNINVGKSSDLGAKYTPDDAKIEYVSNNPSIAEVNENGIVTGINEGEAIISITVGDELGYVKSTANVTVKVNLNDAYISANNIKLNVGENTTLDAIIDPEDLKVNYSVADENIVNVDENGVVLAIAAGNTTITLSVGDGKVYAINSTTINVTVSKIPTEINVDKIAIQLKAEDMQNINATLKPKEAGNLTYESGNESIATVDADGLITACGKGTTTILISFVGDDKYAEAQNKTVFVSVDLEDSSVSSKDIELKAGEKATIEINTTPSGLDVVYSIDDDAIATVDENGVVTAIKAGNTTITILTKDDGIHAISSTIINLTVKLNNASVIAENLDLKVGDNSTIIAKTTPEGLDIYYQSNDTNVATVDENGTVVAVGEGTAIITLSVGDDVTYAVNSTDVTVTVSKIPTEISVEDDNVELKVGKNASAGANLTPADAGNVTYSVTNSSVVKVEDGKLVAVGAGEAVVTVSFAGDEKYCEAENKTIHVSVSLNDASVSVENDTMNLTVDDESSIVAKTTPDDLAVNYESNDTNVATVDENGTVVAVGEGTAIITVSVGDDKTYAVNTTTVTLTVNPKEESAKEDLNVSVSAKEITAGDNATVVVSGLDDATGNVTAAVNGEDYTAPIVDGVASITVPGLTENATAVVSYPGDDKYNNFTKIVDIIVNPKVEPHKEDLNVSVSADPITEGGDAVIEVSGLENATGNVTATVNGKDYTAPIVDSTALITVSDLAENATAVVSYPGDDMYNNFTEIINITVNPKEEPVPSKENITMDVSANSPTEGENTTLDVTLPEDATGNVTATVDGKNYTASVKDGKATLNIPELAAGNYTIPVTYSGDDKYNSITKDVNLTVEKDKSDIISAPDVVKYFGGSERFVVNVTDSEGNPVANKSVTIVVNGQKYDRTTKADGTTSIGLSLNSGVYNATVTVDNNTYNSVVTVLSTVNGTDVVKVFRNATQYYATFRDSEGNYLKEGTVVTFNINGVMYERKISGSEGLAKLNLNLEQGTYVLTAMNPETGENAANIITIISRLIENRDITKYYRNATQYTVKVIGDDGNPVGAGESVTFNINGVFYTRQTNESGIAKLNLNLQPGDYIITAEYKNCKVSNNIKILPVLSAEDISMKYRDGTQFKAKLVDGQGKPLANEKIEFNINGVFYYRTTGSDGIAKLNINLQAGEYIITSSYNGANIANTVTVAA